MWAGFEEALRKPANRDALLRAILAGKKHGVNISVDPCGDCKE